MGHFLAASVVEQGQTGDGCATILYVIGAAAVTNFRRQKESRPKGGSPIDPIRISEGQL